MRQILAEGATHPLWVVPKGMGNGGVYSRTETAVDESRKEAANRVARYQADS